MSVDLEKMPDYSRREFIRTFALTGAAVLLLPLASAQAQTPAETKPVAKYIPVGKTADFKVGNFTKVVLPSGQSIYVTKNIVKKTVSFLALSSVCTHKGCVVLWAPDAKRFKCPCHGGQFDATGKNVAGPPPTPLASFPTKVVKGQVLVLA